MFRVLAMLTLVVGLSFPGVSARAAPLEAYGRLPLIEEARISPDGAMIAYAVTDGENRTILIRRLADGLVLARIAAGDHKLRDISWAGSAHLIYTMSKTGTPMDFTGPRREMWLSVVFDLATGAQRGLMEDAPGAMTTVYGHPRIRLIDGELYAIVEGVDFEGNRGRLSLFRIRLRDGKGVLLAPGLADTDDWEADAAGDAFAQSEYDQRAGQWRLRMRRGKDWPVVASADHPIDSPRLVGLGRDGQSLLVSDVDRDGAFQLREYPKDGGAPQDVPASDYDQLVFDPVTRALVGTGALIGEDFRYSFFNPRVDAAWRSVLKAFPGLPARLVSASDNWRQLVVLIERKTLGPGYVLVDLDAKKAEWLGDVYAGLKPADIAEVRYVTYKAADGLTITGYLTLPSGRDPRGLPLVVLPHGGPASRDTPGFDWWAQALASRGYAVLQPNFRGSNGFGRVFLEAGYGQWGRKMQTDLSDGVRFLAGEGIIDPKRVCIVGGSYGGYAALAGATIDTGVYRCAAAVAGVSDLQRMLASGSDRGRNSTTRYWARFMGVSGANDPALDALSPVNLASRVTIPILLVHGKDDTVVRYEQSELMAKALRKAGKPVDFVTLPGEDHWLSRGATRLLMLQSLVAFLERHNPPG
ncbi:MAG: S9 family peptidase [Caulobacter sp.]|nr:S9 family peptidase [Caulobacter sp.]